MIFDNSIDADKIVQIKEIPYIDNCNDIIFWSLVQQKNNIPELIQKLTDETVLKDVYVPNFGGEYTVADVSLSILNEKIKGIPVFELIGRRFSEDCGYCSYWYFVRENKENRLLLQLHATSIKLTETRSNSFNALQRTAGRLFQTERILAVQINKNHIKARRRKVYFRLYYYVQSKKNTKYACRKFF